MFNGVAETVTLTVAAFNTGSIGSEPMMGSHVEPLDFSIPPFFVELDDQPQIEFLAGPVSASESSVIASSPHIAGEEVSTVTVTLTDDLGNPKSGKVETDFTFALTGSAGVVSGSFAEVLDGVYSFEVQNNVAETVSLTVSVDQDGSPVPVELDDNPEILFLPGAPASLAFIRQPQNAIAGEGIGVVEVHILDAFDNLVTSATNSILLQLGDPSSGATLFGTTGQAAVGGVAIFTDLYLEKTGTYTLTAGGIAGVTSATSDEFLIAVAAAAQLIVEPDGLSQRRNVPFDVKVILADRFGNPVENQFEDVTITLSGLTTSDESTGAVNGDIRPQGFTPGGVDDINPSETLAVGVISVTFSNVLYTGLSDPNSGMDIRLTAEGNGGGTEGTAYGKVGTVSISVRDSFLSIEAIPDDNIVADGVEYSVVSVTFEGFNEAGDVVPISNTWITLTTNLGTLKSGTATSTTLTLLTNELGQVSATLTSTTADTATVSAKCPGACLVSTEVTFIPGAVDPGKSFVYVFPDVQVADGSSIVYVDIVPFDANDNFISGLTEDDFEIEVTGTATATNFEIWPGPFGFYSYDMTNTVAETVSVTVTVNGVVLEPKPEAKFVAGQVSASRSSVVASSPAFVGEDAPSTVTVTLRDEFDNPINVVTDITSLDIFPEVTGSAFPDPGTLIILGNGVYSFQVFNDVAETVTLTFFADNNVLGGGLMPQGIKPQEPGLPDFVQLDDQPQIEFLAGPVSASESSVVASSPHIAGEEVSTVTVILTDQFSNPKSGKVEGDFTLALTGSAGVVSGSFTETASGVYSLMVENLVAETVSLTVTVDGATLDDRPEIVFVPGAPAILAFDVQPTDAAAGEVISPAVEVHILDANDNLVTSATNSVLLQLGDPSSGATLFGTTGQAAVGGIATFTDLYLEQAGTYTLTAGGIVGVLGATSDEFTVSAASALQLAFGVQPTETVAGESIDPAVTVHILDVFGNTVIDATNEVSLAISGGAATLSGTVTVDPVSGVATYTDLFVGKAGTYSLTATADGLTPDSSNNFDIVAGPLAQFIVEPNDLSQRQNVPFSVDVTLADAFGNIIESIGTTTVTLTGENTSAGAPGAVVGDLLFVGGATPSATVNDGESTVAFTDVLYTGLSDPNSGRDIRIIASAFSGDVTGDELISVRGTYLLIDATPADDVVADGTDASTILVTFNNVVEDGPDTPQAGQAIVLQTTLGVFAGSGTSSITLTTDSNGQVSATLTSTNTGTAVVSANCPGACMVSTEVTFVAGPVSASASSVTATTPHLAAEWDFSVVTIVLNDAQGHTLEGLAESDFEFLATGLPGTLISGFNEVGDGEYAFEVSSLVAGELNLTVKVTKGDDPQVELDQKPVILFNPVFSYLPDEVSTVDNSDEGFCTFIINSRLDLEPVLDPMFDEVFVSYTLSGATVGTVTGTTLGPGGVSLDGVGINFGTTTITWTVKDADGNTADATYVVRFEPTSLRGVVKYYKYDAHSFAMQGVTVNLLNEADDYALIASAVTDGSGEYYFATLNHVAYEDIVMEVSTDMPHGGLSSVDALAVLRIAAQLPVTYWDPASFIVHVGNVDNRPAGDLPPSGAYGVNARNILRRVVNPTGVAFASGNWAFYSPFYDEMFNNEIDGEIQLNTARLSGLTCEIWARAYGDVRGQYPDPSKAADNRLQLQDNDAVYAKPGEAFSLPLIIHNEIAFNAMTLILHYNDMKVEVLDIRSKIPGMLYSIQDGTIRATYASLQNTQHFHRGDALIEIKLRTIGEVSRQDELFTLSGLTEFADEQANLIPWFDLSVNSVTGKAEEVVVDIVEPNDARGISLEAYPNPFRSELNLVFDLERPSDVSFSLVNAQGRRVAEISSERYSSGRNQLVLEARNYDLEPGLYFIRLTVDDGFRTYQEVKRVVYMR